MKKDKNTRAEESGDRRLAWPGDPESLTAEAIDFEALAHVLANTCRRGGRLRRFHSLAAHAVAMSEAIEELGGPRRVEALYALIHEASAAWLGAETATSKSSAERLKRLGGVIDRAVRESAGLDPEPSPEGAELVRFIARMAEAAEERDLPGACEGANPAVVFPPLNRRIRPVDPDRAAKLWLKRFHDLKEPPGLRGVRRGRRGESSNHTGETICHAETDGAGCACNRRFSRCGLNGGAGLSGRGCRRGSRWPRTRSPCSAPRSSPAYSRPSPRSGSTRATTSTCSMTRRERPGSSTGTRGPGSR